MLKIGVLGAGHLGKIHLKLLSEIPEYELVGFYDADVEKSWKIREEMSLHSFENIETLIDAVDVVDIVTPTVSHYACAEKAARKSKHIFIEKPLTSTLEEAKLLVDLVEEANVKVMVGHVERFNPANLALKDFEVDPLFIESHRLSEFNPRGTDVSVVLDLMIHDIDIVLSKVKANVKKISASGVPIVSDSPDIANARIEFDNGCVANITASRLSMKSMRKMRIFQRNAYITMDFLKKKSEIFSLSDQRVTENDIPISISNDKKKYIHYKPTEKLDVNSIKMELESFANAINNDLEPEVTVVDGFRAMEVAYQIMEKIESNYMKVR